MYVRSSLCCEDFGSVSYFLGQDTQTASGNVSSLGNRHQARRIVERTEELDDGLTHNVVLYMRLNLSTDTTPLGNTSADKPIGR